MAESKTLEDFISEYVENKLKSNTKESYESWLRTNGINSEKIYSDAINDIESDYKKQLSGYGNTAEALSSLGLTSSGYSDYINGKAFSEMQKSKSIARSEYSENSAKNAKGYSEYIKAYEKAETEKFEDVLKAVTNDNITDYDTAYRYAVNYGLSEEAAAEAATIASDTARKALKEYVMKRIISAGLGRTQTVEFALGLGLSQEEAEELGERANTISKYFPSNDY